MALILQHPGYVLPDVSFPQAGTSPWAVRVSAHQYLCPGLSCAPSCTLCIVQGNPLSWPASQAAAFLLGMSQSQNIPLCVNRQPLSNLSIATFNVFYYL